jgi:hypothetical protein
MKIEVTQHGRKISMDLEGEDQTLSEIIGAFEDVLKALGYCFDGNLDIINEMGE